MGKSKPRNRNKNRDDPTGKRIKPPADPELAALREQRILPVLKDLQSPDLRTRSAAASAITNIIEDQKCRKLLLREQIVRILFEQTLSDSNLETRAAGWGILRNLALEEEADFCVHLYRQDVLTAIDGVVKTIISTIENRDTPLVKLPKPQQDLVWGLSTSIINLVSSLGEAQDDIVEAIIKLPTITNFLFGLLIFQSTPDEVLNEALSCLTVLSEDNKPLCEQISKKQEWLNVLDKMKDSGDLKSVVACGVLHNVFITLKWYDHNTPVQGASDATLLPILVEAIDTPITSNGTNGSLGNSTPDQILQLALEITASIATSLQEALEHGSKHEKPFEGFEEAAEELDEGEDTKMDEDEASDVEGSQNDESDDELTQEMEADMERVTAFDSEAEEEEIQEVTLDRLVRTIAPKLIPLASDTKSAAHAPALSALNNIAWTIGSIDFSTGHLRSLQKFWSSLAQKAWISIISPVLASNTADIDLASTITSLAWAIARSVKGAVQIASEEQRKFMALYQASKSLSTSESESDAFQSLGVKSIGVLGCLALDPAPIALNREIGVFLITTLSALPETPAADAIEALNAIFDIYADKSYEADEPVFWGDGFYRHLEEVQPKIKKMAKGIDKRKFEELRARSDEVVLNLARFLVYKRKEKEGKA